MGAIVFWTIVRIIILIPTLFILFEWMEYKYWWMLGIMSIYGVVLYPAMIQYRRFIAENYDIIEGTLCSSCKYFDGTAVICLKHDEHPTEKYLPCDGIDWTPKAGKNEKETYEEYN